MASRSVIGALRVVLGLDSAQFESGIKRVSRTNQQLVKNTQVAANAVRGLAAALGVVSVGAAARGYLSLADQSAKLTAQLRLATAQTGSFAKAQQDVQRIAAETRTGIAETADLYATFQRNASELGITQEQAARSTETITKAFRISGATAAEAAGGLRQFLQGIQSGTLRGEELNSVLENAPRLARALADGLGVSIGQLREMGKEGQLTGERVIAALEGAANTIDREFAKLPVTFNESMTLVHNAAVTTFGAFDRGGQFSTALANFITDGSNGFADLESSAEQFGRNTRAELDGLAAAFGPVISQMNELLGLFNAATSQGPLFKKLTGEVDAITGWVGEQGLIGRLVTGGSVGDWWNNRPTRGTNFQASYLANYNRSQRNSVASAAEQRMTDAFQRYDVLGNPIAGGRPSAGGSSAGGKSGGGKSAESLRKAAERDAQRAADAMRRFADTLDREEADLSSALAELSGDTSALADARMQQIEADRASRQRHIEADDRLSEAQRQQLINLNNENAAVERRIVRKREIEDELEKQDRIAIAGLDLEMELLSLSSDLARSAAGQRDVELRILDMAFERERLELEGIKARNAVTSAEWQIADARLRQLGTIQAGAKQQVISRTQGPLESFLDRLPRTADEAREALERVQVDGVNGIIDGLADAATGARSLGDVFKNVTNQIIADLLRIQMRKALVGGLSSALGGLFGGGGLNFGSAAAGVDNALAAIPKWQMSDSGLPGFATGGSFKVGGMPGIDKNIITFKASRGEMVDIRKPGNDDAGRMRVDVIPSPYFDVRVNGQIMQAAPAIADAGGKIGMANVAHRNSRRLA